MKKPLLLFFAFFAFFLALPLTKSLAKPKEITVSVGGREYTEGEYIKNVLAAYINGGEDGEVLKACAVVIRGDVLYIKLFGSRHGHSFCGDGNCCFSLGDFENLSEENREKIENAVKSTKGSILTDKNGFPISASFSAGSGSLDLRAKNGEGKSFDMILKDAFPDYELKEKKAN